MNFDSGMAARLPQSMRLVVALALGWFLAAEARSQPVDRLTAAVQAKADGDRFMGSVLIAKGREVVFELSSGWANAEWKVPNTATTKFRLGSVTKQFTAACILLLQERGRLGLDDPLSKHIPGVPAAWKPITLRHLLGHTSGIPDTTTLPPYKEWRITGPSPAMIFERVREFPLEFSPGAKFQYSNTGYILLGWVIERVSGQIYRDFVRQNIFEPLGMTDSGYDSTNAFIPQRAAGYRTGARGLRNANYLDMRVPFAAGGLYSTTCDLLKWTQALYGGRLLRPTSLAQMTKPGRGGYALGLVVGEKNGRRRFAHAGGIDGFGAFLAYFPASGVTIVVLANVEGPAAPELEERLEAIYFGD